MSDLQGVRVLDIPSSRYPFQATLINMVHDILLFLRVSFILDVFHNGCFLLIRKEGGRGGK